MTGGAPLGEIAALLAAAAWASTSRLTRPLTNRATSLCINLFRSLGALLVSLVLLLAF